MQGPLLLHFSVLPFVYLFPGGSRRSAGRRNGSMPYLGPDITPDIRDMPHLLIDDIDILADCRFLIAAFIFDIVVIISVEIEIRHQFGLYVVYRLGQGLQELVKVFLIEENFMPVITVFIEFLPAFGDSKIIIITTGCPYIEEIRPAFPGPDAFAINAFHSFVVVVVRHNDLFCS